MLLDFLLIILIGVCITYCWVLNRRIQDLQNSRIEFARMVKELNVSIVKASNSVTELNELSKITNNELKSSISTASSTLKELIMINEIGNNLASKLSNQITSLQNKNNTSAANNRYLSNTQQYEHYRNNEQNSLGSKFTDDDLTNEQDDTPNIQKTTDVRHHNDEIDYTGSLRNFLDNNTAVPRTEEGVNLNQLNYYDSLRKVNIKK